MDSINGWIKMNKHYFISATGYDKTWTAGEFKTSHPVRDRNETVCFAFKVSNLVIKILIPQLSLLLLAHSSQLHSFQGNIELVGPNRNEVWCGKVKYGSSLSCLFLKVWQVWALWWFRHRLKYPLKISDACTEHWHSLHRLHKVLNQYLHHSWLYYLC